MRVALASKRPQRQQIDAVVTYPAPVGGWNARDALAAMKPTDAVRLINWFPRTTDCVIRSGREAHATGMTGDIETLAIYNGMDGSNQLFASSDDGLWDVSSSGDGTPVVATVTNGRWQWVNMGNGTDLWLLMFNGTDKPLYFDGTDWVEVDSGSTPALSNVTSSLLIYPMVYQGRLFLIEKDTLSTWYLDAGAVGGALTEFDFSSIFKMGGFLMAQGAWTIDGGSGVDDYAAFVSSEGEVAIYKGTNPSSAETWTKVGTYFLGKPIGRRCLVNYGGDLVLICQNGAFPLSQALLSATIDYQKALTNKIENAFTEASRSYSANFGWEGMVFPAQSAFLFNIPVAEGVTAKQYVMNTITKAWCEFDSWNFNTFCVYNGELYAGGAGIVDKAWTGRSDGGGNIFANGKTAFSNFGDNSQVKNFKLFRPLLRVNGPLSFLTGLDVDFSDTNIEGSATYSVTAGAQWDVSNWDEAYWAANLEIVKDWTSPQQNIGYWAAGKVKIATNALEIQWASNDYVFEKGGVIG